MPTDAEIGKFLTERVLGWELESITYDHSHLTPEAIAILGGTTRTVWFKKDSTQRIGDNFFLTWDGFGLLWNALVKAGRKPAIGSDYDVAGPCKQGAYVNDDEGWPVLVIDPDPCRALMLAAAKAYGMEGL